MAITNPQAVAFSNQKARALADALVSAYLTAEACIRFAEANKADADDAFIADAKGVIADNADKDGRPIATGEKVSAVMAIAKELVADFLANDSEKLKALLAFAVNGRSRIDE